MTVCVTGTIVDDHKSDARNTSLYVLGRLTADSKLALLQSNIEPIVKVAQLILFSSGLRVILV